jgi:ABC-2 type transport system ATP-binding protein
VVVIRDGRIVAAEGVEALLSEGGKVVTADLTDPPPLSAFDLPEVSHAEYLREGRLRLICTGGYDALLDVLAAHRVEDVEIRESDLDDVFRHFYEEGEEGEAEYESEGDEPDDDPATEVER